MFSVRQLAAGRRRQLASVTVLALVVGLVAALTTPLGGIIRAAGSDEPRQAPVPQVGGDRSQAEALADGVVSRSEYDAAVDRTLACVREAGGEVLNLRYEDFRDRPVWNFVLENAAAASPDGLTPYDECWMRFSRDVQAKWVEQSVPAASKRADNEARALECAKQENLGADDMDALNALFSSPAVDRRSLSRCLTIAYKGYDPVEHPPLGAE
jgi:hypothetical protein